MNEISIPSDGDTLPMEMRLKKLEDELFFDFGVSRTMEFTTKPAKDCIICDNSGLSGYIARFISSSSPNDKIRKLAFYKFGISLLDEDINEHRQHIACKYHEDDELKDIALHDLKLVESEIVEDMNEDSIIESQILQLTALAHVARKNGDIKEYMDCSDKLYKWVVLKKKLKQEMPTSTNNVMFGDVIKLATDEKDGNDGNTITTRPRKNAE